MQLDKRKQQEALRIGEKKGVKIAWFSGDRSRKYCKQ